MKELLEKLEAKLKAHDWYYMMSSSPRNRAKGQAEYKEIVEMVKKSGEKGKGLFVKYLNECYTVNVPQPITE